MYKVILVEDETLLRRGLLMTTPWQQLNMEVVGEAATGTEGLALIERVHPDIVMTDIRMPGMDGLAMIRAAEPEGAGAYIVLTGFGEFQLAREALQLGVCDYLLKPVDDEELVAALRRAAARASCTSRWSSRRARAWRSSSSARSTWAATSMWRRPCASSTSSTPCR